jgi:hypothetical protein
MAPGGLLQIVTSGLQDKLLINNPEITFFKSIFYKVTNFSVESTEQNFTLKSKSKNHIKIQKTGDLLKKIMLKIEFPAIYAEFDISDNNFNIITSYTTKNNIIYSNLNNNNNLSNSNHIILYFDYIDSIISSNMSFDYNYNGKLFNNYYLFIDDLKDYKDNNYKIDLFYPKNEFGNMLQKIYINNDISYINKSNKIYNEYTKSIIN